LHCSTGWQLLRVSPLPVTQLVDYCRFPQICSNASCFPFGAALRGTRRIADLLAMAQQALLPPPCAPVEALNLGHQRNATLANGGKQPLRSHCCERRNVFRRGYAGRKDGCAHISSVFDSALSQAHPRPPRCCKTRHSRFFRFESRESLVQCDSIFPCWKKALLCSEGLFLKTEVNEAIKLISLRR